MDKSGSRYFPHLVRRIMGITSFSAVGCVISKTDNNGEKKSFLDRCWYATDILYPIPYPYPILTLTMVGLWARPSMSTWGWPLFEQPVVHQWKAKQMHAQNRSTALQTVEKETNPYGSFPLAVETSSLFEICMISSTNSFDPYLFLPVLTIFF